MAKRKEDHYQTTYLDDGQSKWRKRRRDTNGMRIVLFMSPTTPGGHSRLDISSQQ